MKPLALDLCCGLGGWSHGLIAEGWDVVGYDIEQHQYNGDKYPGQLVIQDIRTIDGQKLRGKVSLITASPPCTEFSYMSMPWSRGKQIEQALLGKGEFPAGYKGSKTIAELTELFDACVRIGKEADCPTIIENVRGAQKWVGSARWAWGSFYLWGDVPALMPIAQKRRMTSQISCAARRFEDRVAHALHYKLPDAETLDGLKLPGNNGPRRWDEREVQRLCDAGKQAEGVKVESANGRRTDVGNGARFTTRDCGIEGVKGFTPNGEMMGRNKGPRQHGSKSNARKAASATIAKIPLALAQWVAKVYYPKPHNSFHDAKVVENAK